jgi:plastocyanin
MRALLAGLLFTVVFPSPMAAEPAGGSAVRIWASAFRFCLEPPCQIDDQAYVRNEAGPTPGTDNPDAFVPVRPGDTVLWVYGDKECDGFNATAPTTCPGHEVWFESDPYGAGWIGDLPARRGEVTLQWKVPEAAPPGHVLRYFCNVNGHFRLGVTGALIVG